MPNEEDKREAPEAEGEREREREDRGVRQRIEALIPDLVKRTVSSGLGVVFTTEEGIRKMAADFSLPKDVANYLVSSAQSTKDELFKAVARETRDFLERMNVQQELAKLLTQLSLEVKTEIRFIPNENAISGVKPDVKRKVAIRRIRADGTIEEVGDPEADE